MGYYQSDVKHISGIVEAVNQQSADAQLNWIVENHTCFCIHCCEGLKTKYSTTIKPLHFTTCGGFYLGATV